MATNIGTNPQDIPLNQYLGQQAFLDYPAAKPLMLAHQVNNSATYRGSQSAPCDTTLRVVQFGDVRYDNYGAYDKSTGEYTVPLRGVYLIHVAGNIGLTNVGSNIQIWAYLNGSQYKRAYLNKEIQNGQWYYSDVNMHVPCEKGDILTLRGQAAAGNFWWDDDGKYSEKVIMMVT